MTRFARARGSKASNERLPEIPTSWSIMKRQLLEKNCQKDSDNSAITFNELANTQHSANEKVPKKIPVTVWEEFNVPGTLKQGENYFVKFKTNPNINKQGSQSHLTENQKRRLRRQKKALFGPQDNQNNSKKVNDNNIADETDKKEKKKRRRKRKNVTDVGSEKDPGKVHEVSSPLDETDNCNNSEVQIKKKKIKLVSKEFTDNANGENCQVHDMYTDSTDTVKKAKKRKNNKHDGESDNITHGQNDFDSVTIPIENKAKKCKKSKNYELYENIENDKINLEHKKKKKYKKTEDENDVNESCLGVDKQKKNMDNEFRFSNKHDGQNGFASYKNNFYNKHDSFSRSTQNRPNSMYVGGNIVEIGDFQGFAVKKEDADRLYKLRKDMVKRGIPRQQIEFELKAERRRAEKALSREKKVVCFKCRKFGHNMSECPELSGESEVGNICFKCGSTEHTYTECRVIIQKENFKFAQCFVCKEQGHIARQCPDNPRGLYPKGGGCKVCGDVTHLKKDCPQSISEKEKNVLTLATLKGSSLEVLDEELSRPAENNFTKKVKKVKF